MRDFTKAVQALAELYTTRLLYMICCPRACVVLVAVELRCCCSEFCSYNYSMLPTTFHSLVLVKHYVRMVGLWSEKEIVLWCLLAENSRIRMCFIQFMLWLWITVIGIFSGVHRCNHGWKVGGHLTWGPIYQISYDNLTIMPKLRSTYDGCLIYKTSYSEWKAFYR